MNSVGKPAMAADELWIAGIAEPATSADAADNLWCQCSKVAAPSQQAADSRDLARRGRRGHDFEHPPTNSKPRSRGALLQMMKFQRSKSARHGRQRYGARSVVDV